MTAPRRLLEVFLVALRLGLTSFGGPIAHLGYFREAYVTRRRWLSEREFADLVALCQFLPGPASSQVGFGVGCQRAGVLGGFSAWLGFTLPSAALMTAFALGMSHIEGVSGAGWLRGLKIAAVGVVAHAVWGMGRALCPDRERASLAVVVAALVLLVPTPWIQVGAILMGAIVGGLRFRPDTEPDLAPPPKARRRGVILPLGLFLALFVLLPLGARLGGDHGLEVADASYRSGSLVFGGGHVVLPLLEREMVEPGWVDHDTFLAGYGAAQAVPGPLLTFSAFLGASMREPPSGVAGAALCLTFIFLPSWLLVLGVLPLWSFVRRWTLARAAISGANAAVVGLLLAALYQPVWSAAIDGVHSFVIALGVFGLLQLWRVPAWAVVALAAGAGQVLLAP